MIIPNCHIKRPLDKRQVFFLQGSYKNNDGKKLHKYQQNEPQTIEHIRYDICHGESRYMKVLVWDRHKNRRD